MTSASRDDIREADSSRPASDPAARGQRIDRRRFLGLALSMAAAGAGAAALLRWTGGGGADSPDTTGDESDAELAAFRRAAREPGPAEARIAAMDPPPRRRAHPLPFPRDGVPGFSAGAHHLHWNHHYLEYLWRWESNERALLQSAAEATRASDSAQRATCVEAARAASRAALDAARMVILHECFWEHLWGGGPVSPPDPRTAEALLRTATAPGMGWLVALKTQEGATGTVAIDVATAHDVPFGAMPLAGIDWAAHSWRLDFEAPSAYAAQLARTMPALATAALLMPALGRKRFDPGGEDNLRRAAEHVSGIKRRGEGGGERASVEDLCVHHRLDHEEVRRGLRFAAGAAGFAVRLRDFAGDRPAGVFLLRPGEPSGLWRHTLDWAAAGVN